MSRSLRSKCVAAMVEHLLGEVATVGSSLDPEVPKHGIGLPATKELDVVLVDSSAQECGGSTRAEASGGEKERVDACEWFEVCSGKTEGTGNELARGLPFPAVTVKVGADGGVCGDFVFPQMRCDAGQGLCGA